MIKIIIKIIMIIINAYRPTIMNNNETSVILNLFRLIALIIHDSLLLTVSFMLTLLFGLNYLYIECMPCITIAQYVE